MAWEAADVGKAGRESAETDGVDDEVTVAYGTATAERFAAAAGLAESLAEGEGCWRG